MRLYVPATSTLIERLILDGEIPVTIGFAVTPSLREWYHADEEEELEYVASMAAAKASLELLVHDAQAQRRRAVLALEVSTISPLAGQDRAAVDIASPLRADLVESALVDSIEAADDIAAAIAAWDRHDDDAHFIREQAHSHELLWFARQELPFIF